MRRDANRGRYMVKGAGRRRTPGLAHTKEGATIRKYSKILGAFIMSLAPLFGPIDAANAQENRVTAIDILLEPDATMVQHAQVDNARLLGAYPAGFALDPTHQPHLTLIQQFVRTADLERVDGAANKVLAQENVASWDLKAIRYYYIPVPPNGITGIVVEPTEKLLRLQRRLLDAVAPFMEKTGTAAAFVSADGGRDIQDGLIDYVANFRTVAAGEKFNPHVTIGVALGTLS